MDILKLWEVLAVFVRRCILFSLVLAVILVQGIDAASFLNPSLKEFRSALENRYDGAQPNELSVQKDEAGSEAIASRPNVLIRSQIFPLVGIDSGVFGSKVLYSDNDVGRTLINFKYDPSLCFWDVGIIDNEFDEGDVVYYHFNRSSPFLIEQNDIRLTAFGTHFPGSKVAADDADSNKPLKAFPRGSAVIFVDQYGSRGYDLLDPVYFHIDENNSQTSRMDLRMSYFAYGPAGTLINGHDQDLRLPISSNFKYKVRFYNINGNVKSDGMAIYDEMDPVYLDISGIEEPGFVVVNDVRLS